MTNIRNKYLKIVEVIRSLNVGFNPCVSVGRKPKTTDIEVFALNLTAAFMSIDSENSLI